MSSIRKTFRFYAKPLLVVTLINLSVLILFGAYLEGYEGIFSGVVQGMYARPANLWYDTTNYFLVLYLYERLVEVIPGYNIYGIMMFLFTWFCLTFSGLVLYRTQRINFNNSDWLVFVLLYTLLSLDNFVNLNCTRHSILLIVSVLLWIESVRLEGKKFMAGKWLIIVLLIILSNLFRFEAAMFFSAFYISLLILFRRHTWYAWLPFVFSLALTLTYNIVIAEKSSEAKKAFIYKERELVDRENVDYDNLNAAQKLEVQAIIQYGITDKEFFTLAFYDSISKYKYKKDIPRFVDGFRFNTFKTSLAKSAQEIYAARYFVIFYIVSAILLFAAFRKRDRKILLLSLGVILIPFLLCLYTIVPQRFLVPYFAIFTTLNALWLLKAGKRRQVIYFGCFCLMLNLYSAWNAKQMYKQWDAAYLKVTGELQELSRFRENDKPLIIHNFFAANFFPVNPFRPVQRQPARFLNFYYFTAWEFSMESWKEMCGCNPLSLKEKVDYMVASESLFLIDEGTFGFLQKYFRQKYAVELHKTDISNFTGGMKVCRLRYDKETILKNSE